MREVLELVGNLPQWMVALLSAVVGFILGVVKDLYKETRDTSVLRNALYQEIANNYEAIHVESGSERWNGDFKKLASSTASGLTSLAYEAAARSPLLFRITEHGWIIACYRECKKFSHNLETCDSKEIMSRIASILGTIENVPPSCITHLEKCLRQDLRANIRNKPNIKRTSG